MYGIYTNIGGILMVNVTIYSIHGSYGLEHKQIWTILIHQRELSSAHNPGWFLVIPYIHQHSGTTWHHQKTAKYTEYLKTATLATHKNRSINSIQFLLCSSAASPKQHQRKSHSFNPSSASRSHWTPHAGDVVVALGGSWTWNYCEIRTVI